MVIVSYCILLVFYVGLILVHLFYRKRQESIPPWPVLEQEVEPEKTHRSSCEKDEDCPDHCACLNRKCVPKLLRGNDCYSPMGIWKEHTYRGAKFAICACTMPEYYTQTHFGGNCNVPIGCGLHGRYDIMLEKCDCDPGYQEVDHTCVKALAVQQTSPPTADDVSLDSADFHLDYVAKWKPHVATLKRPCSFDMITGRPLKHAKYDPDSNGCVCDPRYGQFGVRVPDTSYVAGAGYNGCASIFTKDPDEPQEVTLYEFYYLGRRETPVALIAFKNVDVDSLESYFQDYLRDEHQKKQGAPPLFIASFMVGQEWIHGYGQYVLRAKEVHYTARTRECPVSVFGTMHCDEWVYVSNYQPLPCHLILGRNVQNRMNKSSSPHSQEYDTLYAYPVCSTRAFHSNAFVLNPHQIEHRTSPNLLRFNGLSIHYQPKEDRWMVDMADYKAHVFFSVDNNASKRALQI